MILSEYLQKYKFTFDGLIPEIAIVRDEAAEHCYRKYTGDLVSAKRPLESETIKEWRIKNKRFIHHEIVDITLRECQVNISKTGFNLQSKSDILEDWIRETKFHYLTTEVNIWEYYLNSILPDAIADPNSYVLVIPSGPNDTHPSQLNEFDRADVKMVWLTSEKIKKAKSDQIFIAEGGEIKVKDLKKVWYWVADKEAVYQAIPTEEVDKEGKTVYNYELWYRHNFGQIPVVIYPGVKAKSIEGKQYQESLFKTAFPYLNEFINSFSDNQWMHQKNNYSTLVMPQVNCVSCGGDGYIMEIDSRVPCKKCDGSGKMKAPGLTDYIILPAGDYDGKTDNRQPYYLTPDIGSLDHSQRVTFDLLDRAAATLGVRPLINTSESGEAMKMRYETLNKTIDFVFQNSIQFLEDVLELVESILVENTELRKKPKIKRENGIALKTPEYLKEIYKSSLPIEKLDAVYAYINSKYSNDPLMLLKYKVLIRYYPETTMENEEIGRLTALGSLTEDQVNRARLAVQVADEIFEDYGQNLLDMKATEIYKLIEDGINQRRSTIN